MLMVRPGGRGWRLPRPAASREAVPVRYRAFALHPSAEVSPFSPLARPRVSACRTVAADGQRSGCAAEVDGTLLLVLFGVVKIDLGLRSSRTLSQATECPCLLWPSVPRSQERVSTTTPSVPAASWIVALPLDEVSVINAAYPDTELTLPVW